jgi:hypothetical protein
MIIIGPFTLFFLLMLFCRPFRRAMGFLILAVTLMLIWSSIASNFH